PRGTAGARLRTAPAGRPRRRRASPARPAAGPPQRPRRRPGSRRRPRARAMSAKYADLGRAAARHPRRRYDFVPPPELGRTTVTRVPVVIVGGGPIGLAMAVD